MRSLMRSRNNLSPCSGILVGLALLLAGSFCLAAPFPPDPVDELRSELRSSLDDLRYRFPELARSLQGADPEKEVATLNRKRESILMDRIAALRTIPEMRRALLLNEWRLVERRDEMAVVDRKVRRALAERFEKQIRQVLQHGKVTDQLAAINIIAEVGPTARAPEDRAGIARDFGPDLAELMKKGHPTIVRATAARALGQIFPDPQLAAKALGDLLATGNVEERRGAAAGLLGMVRVPFQLVTNSDTVGKVQLRDDSAGTVDRAPLAAAGKAALTVAGRGLSDSDPGAGRLCAEAFQQAASSLTDPNIVPQHAGDEPRGRRFLGPEVLQTARAELAPLLTAFKEQAPNLAKALIRDDTRIRELVARTLEDLAVVRNLFERGAGELPPKPPASGAGLDSEGKPNGKIRPATNEQAPSAAKDDPLFEALRSTVSTLARATADPSAQVRLKAIEAIETIGPQASIAAPALVKALNDKDVFVRWAAARALGKVPTNEPDLVVPGLAKLLDDRDFDVNIAAARSLQRFGPAARPALPQLEHALTATDAGKRKEVLRTIQSIGTDASPAIPAIIAVLQDADAPNRQLAAELLGRFGTAAAQAQPALRRLLDDTDPDVRRAASDALLNVEGR